MWVCTNIDMTIVYLESIIISPDLTLIKQDQIYNIRKIINLFSLCQHFSLPFYTYFFFKCWNRLNEPIYYLIYLIHGFFSKKIFWFPMLLKKIFWFWWREKK